MSGKCCLTQPTAHPEPVEGRTLAEFLFDLTVILAEARMIEIVPSPSVLPRKDAGGGLGWGLVLCADQLITAGRDLSGFRRKPE